MLKKSTTPSKCFDKFPVLVSYAYARTRAGRAVFDSLVKDDLVDVLLDCGAFTVYNSGGEIKLDDYLRFVDDYKDNLYGYMSLDVVGNPKATDVNLREAIKQGFKPMPVHVIGDGKQRMDELFELSDCVALGGMYRNQELRMARRYVLTYIKEKMRWAAGRPVHWFGVTRKDLLPTFRPASIDSTTWANGSLYGQLCVYVGNGRWVTAYNYAKRRAVACNSQAMKRCLTVSEDFAQGINLKIAWGGATSPVNDITTDSWVRFSCDVYQWFGTRVFLSTVPNTASTDPLVNAIHRNKHRLLKGAT